MIYVKQHQNSPTSSTDVQKLMESTAEKRFTGQSNGHNTQRERLGKDKVRIGQFQLKDMKFFSLSFL